MDDLLQCCQAVTGSDASFTWVDESFLVANKVGPFTELPLWVPQEEAGLLQVNVQKALREGLSFRPLEETIRDTLNWSNSRPVDYQWRNGMKPKRETELLHEWSRLKR